MIKRKLDSIKEPYVKAFAWRIYNNLVILVVTVSLPVLLKAQESLQEAGDLSPMRDGEFWSAVGFVAVLTTIGILITGLAKVLRTE